MGFFAAVASSYINILSFSGRASRSEYWWGVLFHCLLSVALGFGLVAYFASFGATINPDDVVGLSGVVGVLSFVFITIPATTLMVRRLHDTGRSGWWFWIPIVPIIGTIILLVFMLQRGTPGHNQYGHDPLNPTSRRRNAPKVYAPEIMAKRAKNEAARRAEIMDYYRKNVASNT